jgi:hypothetical protein
MNGTSRKAKFRLQRKLERGIERKKKTPAQADDNF